jgi:hypothetical protein
VIEKLLENWLDNASERSYQAAFVHMLSGQGFAVVHSTRHNVLEYGKDVLAVSPTGEGCAYQLKGNPGGRLGLAQFRQEIQPQLVQLMSQPVVFPGFPARAHKSYLVTNGYFEEEVQRAIDDLNRGPYLSKVELLSRGDLLKWAKELGASLWPSELDHTRVLLEIFLADTADLLPVPKLSVLLSKVLSLGDEETLKGNPEFQRRVTSAALLTGITTAGFSNRENHFSVACAWVLFAANLIAAARKHEMELAGPAAEALSLAEGAAGDALVSLWSEVKGRHHLVEGHAFSDAEVWGWRYTTLVGAFSCLALFDESREILSEVDRDELHTWLRQRHKGLQIWGEAAIACLVPWLVWLRKHDPTLRPDVELAEVSRSSSRKTTLEVAPR